MPDNPGPTPRVRRAGRLLVVVTFLAVLTALGITAVDGVPHGAPERPAGATIAPGSNVAFWYQPITASTNLTQLGKPRVLIHFSASNRPADERLAVERIHGTTGAAAYRYVQLYYLPVRSRIMDMSIARHPGWGFCRSGNTPAYDSSVKSSESWMFVDANDRAVVDAFRAFLLRVKSWGWDGIFIDLAHRALTQDFWDRASTCTRDPVVPGRVSADAYAALVPLARSLGLQVMVNAGPPAGPSMPMRPNPKDPACRAADWSRCHGLDDIIRAATWILHEGASNWADDTEWLADTEALAADEAYAQRGGRAQVAALGVYRGPDQGRTEHTVYQWAVMKLYNAPAAFGTGVDRCGIPAGVPIRTACNRGGLAPAALVDTDLGPPLDAAPITRSCAPNGWHCIWIRRYRDGLVLVNNTAVPLTSSQFVVAGDGACRTVTDVLTGARVAGGSCTATIGVTLAGFRAEILRLDPP